MSSLRSSPSTLKMYDRCLPSLSARSACLNHAILPGTAVTLVPRRGKGDRRRGGDGLRQLCTRRQRRRRGRVPIRRSGREWRANPGAQALKGAVRPQVRRYAEGFGRARYQALPVLLLHDPRQLTQTVVAQRRARVPHPDRAPPTRAQPCAALPGCYYEREVPRWRRTVCRESRAGEYE